MKRIYSILLAACITLLCLGGCGDTGSREDSGLLTEDEVKTYESHYLQGTDTLLDDLGLTEDDIDNKEYGLWALKEPRVIAGKDFTAMLYVAESEEYNGLYGVAYTAQLDAKEIKSLYQAAVKDYGEPTTYQGVPNLLSQNLDKLDGSKEDNYVETWGLGDQTIFSLSIYSGDGELNAVVLYSVRTVEEGEDRTPQAR